MVGTESKGGMLIFKFKKPEANRKSWNHDRTNQNDVSAGVLLSKARPSLGNMTPDLNANLKRGTETLILSPKPNLEPSTPF